MTPFQLTPVRIRPESPEYRELLAWPFPDQPFYNRQVLCVLQNDIPGRVQDGHGLVWVYRDADGNMVGFGTLDLCRDYAHLADGKLHTYIPVLGVHPNYAGRGHGTRIVEHLAAVAEFVAQGAEGISEYLYLDVYEANQAAIKLYRDKCRFAILNADDALLDERENNERYYVMARRIAPSPAPVSPPPPSP